MRRLLRKICLGILFAISAASGAVPAAPKAVKATYGGFMNGMAVGAISEYFEADGGTYRIVSDTKPLGLAVFLQRQPLKFVSKGELTREGLRPAIFEARRSASDPPQVSAEFDWAQGQIQLKSQGRAESLPLNAGTQDRLSIMYQFMFVQVEKARHVDFWMTNGRKLDFYRYRVTPDVELDTALGRIKTLHLVKQRDAGDTHAEVWISPQHHNVAVRLLIVEKDGMRYEQVIQSLDVRD